MRPQVKNMVNPFAYEEYRKDKIRQKIEESRTQRVQLKVGDPLKIVISHWNFIYHKLFLRLFIINWLSFLITTPLLHKKKNS